ncbi:proline-rich extensin-like protein EPR1 [Cornus florida]|uniref:proline-rich extensin-like protein EPR1 n=1 Tax=Cornus florida TaxID=4283 RepID=UPI0028A2CB22|nr:proline-rich extensin-like protein EPR1 [Cornus florida]
MKALHKPKPPSKTNPTANHLKPPFIPLNQTSSISPPILTSPNNIPLHSHQHKPAHNFHQKTPPKQTNQFRKSHQETLPKQTNQKIILKKPPSTTLQTQIYHPPIPSSLSGKPHVHFPPSTINPVRIPQCSNTPYKTSTHSHHPPLQHSPTSPPANSYLSRNFNPLLYSSPAHQIDRLQEQLEWKDENLGKALEMYNRLKNMISELRSELAEIKVQNQQNAPTPTTQQPPPPPPPVGHTQQ